MAVTKQTYTATATWTASQLADVFKTAFIDAGLMTDWFDSFLSGSVENRVLRVINDAGKTYGTIYYWFMFTTSGVFVSTTTGWNAASDVPSGTLYVDYLSTTTNATTNHATLLSLVSTTTCTLTRYTSGVDSSVSLFLLRSGSSSMTFMLSHPSFNASAFVDQNQVAFNHLLFISGSTGGNYSYLISNQAFNLRNTYLGAMSLRGMTGVGQFASTRTIMRYAAFGNANGSTSNWVTGDPSIWLPTANINTHSGLAANHIPVFTSPSISPYMSVLPNDFGIGSYYASSSMVVQDTLVVTASSEEWEMLTLGINTNTDASRIMLLARTV